MNKTNGGWFEAGVRFLDLADAEEYLFGHQPSHPIYPGDPRYEDAPYEIVLGVFQDSFKRATPTPYEPNKKSDAVD